MPWRNEDRRKAFIEFNDIPLTQGLRQRFCDPSIRESVAFRKGVMGKKIILTLPIKPCIFENADEVNKDRQRSKRPLCAISKKSDYVGHHN